jgi:hypothetical protein
MRLLVSGATSALREFLPAHASRLGHLLTPRAWNSAEAIFATGLPVAADNGAYAGLDEVAFRLMLDKLAGQRPLWVVAPDVPYDAKATLAPFLFWALEIHGRGFPVALAGQDGLEDCLVPWESFEALFLGGSTRWKLSQAAGDLAHEARRRGKTVHMGRANSRQRFWVARTFGCDTLDGSRVSRWPCHLADALRWLREIEQGLPWCGV